MKKMLVLVFIGVFGIAVSSHAVYADSASVTNNDVNYGPINGSPNSNAGTWTDSCATGYAYTGYLVEQVSGPSCTVSHSGGNQSYYYTFSTTWTGCTYNGSSSMNCGNNLLVNTSDSTGKGIGSACYYNRTQISETGSITYNNSANWSANGAC